MPSSSLNNPMENSNLSPESQELTSILANTDVSDIHSVLFTPLNWQAFRLETENIRKLSVYITNKLGKTEFGPGELDRAFGFVIQNLHSTLEPREYEEIKEKILWFVQNWGKVEFTKNSILSSIGIFTSTSPIKQEEKNTTISANIPAENMVHDSQETEPLKMPAPNEPSDNKITIKKFLISLFVLQPVSGIAASIVFAPVSGIMFFSGSYGDVLFPVVTLASFIAFVMLYVYLWKKWLHLGTGKLILLLFIGWIIGAGVALIVCGGFIFLLSGGKF